MQKRKAVLVGATGLVGSHCLKQLISDDNYESILVFARREIKTSHPKIKLHIIDFDDYKGYEKLVAGDDLFCALGTTRNKAGSKEAFKKVDVDYPLVFARFGLNNGIKQYQIVSAIGANPNSSIFYSKMKGFVEEELKKLSFEAVNIFRPSYIMGDREEDRPGEKLGITLSNTIGFALKGPLKKYKPIPAEKIAYAMVKVAKQERKGVNLFLSDTIHELFDIDH